MLITKLHASLRLHTSPSIGESYDWGETRAMSCSSPVSIEATTPSVVDSGMWLFFRMPSSAASCSLLRCCALMKKPSNKPTPENAVYYGAVRMANTFVSRFLTIIHILSRELKNALRTTSCCSGGSVLTRSTLADAVAPSKNRAS